MIHQLCILLLCSSALNGFVDPAEVGVLCEDLVDIQLYERKLTGGAPGTVPLTHREGQSTSPSVTGFILRGIITLYQQVLSSQDMPSCNFIPSCSHYGQDAIRVHRALRGTLMTSDRLQRCIGAARRNYPLDPSTLLALDPVGPPDSETDSQARGEYDHR